MSKERAARRTQREAERTARVEKARAKEARAVSRRRVVQAVLPRRGRADSVLLRRRQRQNLVLLAVLLVLNALLWMVVADWGPRVAAALLSLLLWPLLLVLVFDRRPSS